MERSEQLHNIIDELDESVQLLGHSLVDRMLFLEAQLFELEKLPFIEFKKDNPLKQRELPARKAYLSILQQYHLIIKTLGKLLGADTDNDSMGEFKKYLQTLQTKLYGGS